MKPVRFLLVGFAACVLWASAAAGQDKATRDAAQQKHDDAAKEADTEKAMQMLCQAASMVPKNRDFQNECTAARTMVINRGQKYLITAEDAKKTDPEKARRYLGFILKGDPKLDPDTYAKAQQELRELNSPTQTVVAGGGTTPPPPKDQSGTLYAQAQADFRSGNLSGAKSAAQQVTDPALKTLASELVSQVEKYSSEMAEGQRQEAAGHYEQALAAYQTAQSVNRSIASDNLAGKIEHLQMQMASLRSPPPTGGGTPPAGGGSKGSEVARTPPLPPGPKQPESSSEEKKKAFLTLYASAIKNKEPEAAERALRQVVQLDPRDAVAKAQLDDLQKQIAEALNRDPEKLEKTLRDAIQAFYASDFEGAESKLNNYLRASGAKKKGAAYFYLGATEETQALLQAQAKRGTRLSDARDNFKQARSAGYQPVPKYVSEKVLDAWKQAGM